jgi:hypothetical protein
VYTAPSTPPTRSRRSWVPPSRLQLSPAVPPAKLGKTGQSQHLHRCSAYTDALSHLPARPACCQPVHLLSPAHNGRMQHPNRCHSSPASYKPTVGPSFSSSPRSTRGCTTLPRSGAICLPRIADPSRQKHTALGCLQGQIEPLPQCRLHAHAHLI